MVLAERLAALDAPPIAADRHGPVETDIAHFIRVVEAITPAGSAEQLPSPVDANASDEAMRASRLLKRLTAKSPELAIGPLRRDQQYWVSTGRPAHLPQRREPLDRTHFIDAGDAGGVPASTKPFELGLYTSTGSRTSFGMWWSFLQVNSGSSLFPLPWKVWSLTASPEARVFEVTTAADWIDLVLAYPSTVDAVVYPDWRRIAERHDGIHMTVRAIAATQGLHLARRNHVIAPAYWSVESTLWLRWSFAGVRPVAEQQTQDDAP